MNSKHGDTYLKLYICESGSFAPAFLELSILHTLVQTPNRPELLYEGQVCKTCGQDKIVTCGVGSYNTFESIGCYLLGFRLANQSSIVL